MGKSYRVVPDGDDLGWKVMVGSSNGATHRKVSRHRKKSAAKRKARRLASTGDRLVVLRSSGSIQTSVTVQ